ncbi:hypothetical protein DCCM_0451 [Desulfocucumis palustris]|uniref:Uncharacterized protein n=1 Tax=Desulfocucumis palustris TaxID=1898651 RepID=A0A2L2X826_9FIRM|nr:hypothetical protein [Desulfocucumis palustris]GBF32258.1 hypothetical protein DCCM_0451 [Desulfocucumis palustris]
MKLNIKEKFPEWVHDTKYYDLILSNDLDSFFSCQLLEMVKGWKPNYFNYNFSAMGLTEFADGNENIGVDFSLCNSKCFDNHVVMMNSNDDYNYQSANFNIIDEISRENYFSKYCGSTLLTIWSLYDVPLPATEEAKMILLCIDSTFKGFYSGYPLPKKANRKYLVDYMDFPELYECLQRHKQYEFSNLISKYNLAGKISLKKGFLHTDIDLEALRKVFNLPFLLPENKFYKKEEYENNAMSLPKGNYSWSKDDISEEMYSVALTRRDYLNYSIRID